MFGPCPHRLVARFAKCHYHPSKATRRTFAKQHILKGLKARPSTGFINVETIDDVVKNCSDTHKLTTKLHHSIYTELRCNPKLQHLYHLVNPEPNRARCTEKCDTGKLCIENPDFNCTCSHPKGHSISIPHECYACEALTESKEKFQRESNLKKRESIKRKAGAIIYPRGAQYCKHVANVEQITTDMSAASLQKEEIPASDNAHLGDANEHS